MKADIESLEASLSTCKTKYEVVLRKVSSSFGENSIATTKTLLDGKAGIVTKTNSNQQQKKKNCKEVPPKWKWQLHQRFIANKDGGGRNRSFHGTL